MTRPGISAVDLAPRPARPRAHRPGQQMLYFAYGSNMSGARLRQRVPSAQALSVALLAGHRLVFHKVGRDGSAKCDAFVCDDREALLYGVVYRIDPTHKPGLDMAEGLGNGYVEKTVQLRHADGTCSTAFAYCATRIDPTLRPYGWYKEHVLRGAEEHAMPDAYVAMIAAVDAVEDPDPERVRRELSIYR